MNIIKKDFFKTLSKVQKSSIIFYLKKFIVKKKSFDDKFLYEEFIEEQHYYIEIGQPYFVFIADFIEEEDFLKSLKFCIKDLCFKQKQKELLFYLLCYFSTLNYNNIKIFEKFSVQ